MTNKLTNDPAVNEMTDEEREYLESQKMSRTQYEHDVAALEAGIKGSQAAQRLYDNPDFKLLILEGYFKSEPIRISGLLASPQMADPMERQILVEDLIGIGKLKIMLSKVAQSGPQAQQRLEELKDFVAKSGGLRND